MFKHHFLLSVCHTTRSPRTKEENLEDYFFVTQEEFEQGVVMVRFHSALDCLALFIFPLMCQLLDFPSFFDLFFFLLLSYFIFISFFFFSFYCVIHLQGKFLQTCQLAGNWYGVTREAVENVAREGLAAVFHMDLQV